MIKVEGHNNLRKDPHTGAVVNVDVEGYNSYMEALKLRNAAKDALNQRMDAVEDKVNNMMNTLNLILEKVSK